MSGLPSCTLPIPVLDISRDGFVQDGRLSKDFERNPCARSREMPVVTFGAVTIDPEGTRFAHIDTAPPTTSMNLSTAWRPSGRASEAFPALQAVGKVGLVPIQMHHGSWAGRTLEQDLAQSPAGRDAIWQSILFLWRLEYLVSDWERAYSGFRRLWQHYVSEWLVSAGIASQEVGLPIQHPASSLESLQALWDFSISGRYWFSARNGGFEPSASSNDSVIRGGGSRACNSR
jgi:hypothetical protein